MASVVALSTLDGGAGAVGVDGGDAVVTGVAGHQPGVRVGGGGIARVGDLVGPRRAAIGGRFDLVTGDGGAAGAARGGPGEVDRGGPAGRGREAGRGAGGGGAGGGAVDVGRGAGAVGVDGGDAVVTGVAGGQPGVGVGGGGIARVGDEVGPRRAAIGGRFDLVTGDGAAAGARRGGPGEVDRGGSAGRGREAGGGAGGARGGVGDGGDAVHAGGEGRGVVAGGVLDGVGVVAGRGVGVGDDHGLAVGDGSRKLEPEPVLWQCAPRHKDAGDRSGTAVHSDSEGGGRGRIGQLQVLGEI